MNLNLLDIPVYYINMDKDVERRESMERLLKEVGFKNVTRVRGASFGETEHHSPNWKAGCSLSHQLVLSQLTPPFILLEDDCVLGRGFKTEIEVPSDADAVYLGISKLGWSKGHIDVIGEKCASKEVLKIECMLSSHAILYLTRSYLSAAAYAAGVAVRKKDFNDIEFALVQVKYNIYACTPPIFHQSSCSELTDVDLNFLNERKIAFATIATKEIEEYSKYTSRVNSLYCKKHGYDYVLESEHLSDRYATWDKIPLMLRLIDDYDIIFLLDADAVFTDFSAKIEDLLLLGTDFYMLDDSSLRGRPFSVGGGTIICVVDTPEKKDYFKKILNRWWDLGEQLGIQWSHHHEQTAMNVLMFELNYMGLHGKTSLMKHQDIDKFIFHAYARSMEERVPQLRSEMEKLGITLDG